MIINDRFLSCLHDALFAQRNFPVDEVQGVFGELNLLHRSMEIGPGNRYYKYTQ